MTVQSIGKAWAMDEDNKSIAVRWAAGAIIMIVLSWSVKSALDSAKHTSEAVLLLVPKVESLEKRVARVEDWQHKWPTTGELAADVRQSKDIEYLKQADERLSAAVEIVQNRIRELENDK